MKVDMFWLPAATADVRVAGDDCMNRESTENV